MPDCWSRLPAQIPPVGWVLHDRGSAGADVADGTLAACAHEGAQIDGWPHLLGRPLPQHGISLALHGETVSIEIYLIVEPGVSMVDVGTHVQEAVGAAVEHILGMGVTEINVYIQDVA